MLHPFSGLNVQCEETPAQPTRRQVLGTMVFAAGAVAVPALAYGQVPATEAVNEAGRGPVQITTLAIGEEGAITNAVGEAGGRTLPAVTTEPFGEEAGRVTSRVQPGLEDGGDPAIRPIGPGGPGATTLAIGEEGDKVPQPPRPRQVTTEAVNEEGGNKEQQLPQRDQSAVPQAAIGAAVAQVQVVPAVPPVQVQQGQAIQIQVQVQPQVTTQAVGEEAATGALNEGGLTTRAVGEEGATKALNEGGIGLGGVVNVQPMSRDLSEAQLKAVFADLGAADPGKGTQACAVLYGSKQVLTFLKDNLKFVQPKADAAALAKLIKDLDSDDFDTREKAEKELEKIGMAALTALQAALDSKEASMEVKMRAKRLVEKFKDNSPILQAQRGVEVLIALNTPESKALIETLAKGDENDLVVPVAKKALERMKK
jgi:hypothetical protein